MFCYYFAYFILTLYEHASRHCLHFYQISLVGTFRYYFTYFILHLHFYQISAQSDFKYCHQVAILENQLRAITADITFPQCLRSPSTLVPLIFSYVNRPLFVWWQFHSQPVLLLDTMPTHSEQSVFCVYSNYRHSLALNNPSVCCIILFIVLGLFEWRFLDAT
jgi:hypothetical protein